MITIIENTNKTIVINSLILYFRLAVILVCGLFTTRFSLEALGTVDFGLFSVVGSIIVFINIINTTMLGTCNRFIATSIGQGNSIEINRTFNVNLVIHFVFALFTVIVGLILGHYYIYNYIQYEGDIENAITIFNISIIASAISFIGVPYNGYLLARECFLIFSLTNILSEIFRVVMCYVLIYYFTDKLLVYSLIMALTTIVNPIVNAIYCYYYYRKDTIIKCVKEVKPYKEVLSFSLWVGYGAFVQVGKNQMAAVLINAFFNTILNTALSLANSLKSAILLFSENITKPISPQITKNYASGNHERCINLVCLASKAAFLTMLLISSPLIIETRFIIHLWLGQIPDYVVLFTRLVIIDALVGTFNMGIAEYIFANGNIKRFQFCVNTLLLLSVFVAYFLLSLGWPAYYLLIVYILFSIISVIVRQIVLNIDCNFNNMILIKRSYMPSIFVVLLYCPIYFIPDFLHPIVRIIIELFYLILIIFFVGLSHKERRYCIKFIKTKLIR